MKSGSNESLKINRDERTSFLRRVGSRLKRLDNIIPKQRNYFIIIAQFHKNISEKLKISFVYSALRFFLRYCKTISNRYSLLRILLFFNVYLMYVIIV